MPLILGGSSAAAAAFSVDNSCQFVPADSPQLYRTQPGTPTNGKIFTFSCWFKLGSSTSLITFCSSFNFGGGIYDTIAIRTSSPGPGQVFRVEATSIEGNAIDLQSNQLFRDPAAWYHLVFAVDTTQAVAANRDKLYINGTQVTSWGTETHSTQDDTWLMNASGKIIQIGNYDNGTAQAFYDGCLAEVCLIDGQQLDPTSFGEFDEDSPTIFKPKDISALTPGTNGFYLDFEDSANLGNDAFGGTDLTEANIAAANQMIDSPTNNFCTMNPIVGVRSGFTWTYGNTKVITGGTDGSGATMGASTGKWYYELYIDTLGNFYGGWQDLLSIEADDDSSQAPIGGVVMNSTPDVYYNGSGTPTSTGFKGTGSAPTSGDYIGFAFDVPNLKCWWSENGQWYTADNSTASTLTRAQVSANTNGFDCTTGSTMSSSSTVGPYMGCSTSPTTNSFNFGNGRFGATALTGTTYTDDNDQGIFKYEPPDGFRALCTKNLGEFG